MNSSVDSEDDIDSTFSCSMPTPVNTNEQDGGFMKPIAIDIEEDKPFFTRKKSSFVGSEQATARQSNASAMPDYESISLEQLKVND